MRTGGRAVEREVAEQCLEGTTLVSSFSKIYIEDLNPSHIQKILVSSYTVSVFVASWCIWPTGILTERLRQKPNNIIAGKTKGISLALYTAFTVKVTAPLLWHFSSHTWSR